MGNIPRRDPLSRDRGGRPLPQRGVRPEKLQEGSTDADKAKGIPFDADLAEAVEGDRLEIRGGEIVARPPEPGGDAAPPHLGGTPHEHDLNSPTHGDTNPDSVAEHLWVETWIDTGEIAFAEGTYTGDGLTGIPYTGLGFAPKMVVVKADHAADSHAVMRSDTMAEARNLVNATSDQGIASLDADGFTVTHVASANGRTNESGKTYYWWAIGGDGVATGTYTGDGVAAHAITGVGFEPVILFVCDQTDSTSVPFRTADMTTEDYNFATDAGETNRIKSLDADGFTVGTDSEVNTNAREYHFIAVKAGANVATGVYVGNDDDGRALPDTPMAFNPDLVHIKANTGQHAVFKTTSLTGDAALNYYDEPQVSDRIQSLTPAAGQFEVGTDVEVNVEVDPGNTWEYFWFAFGASVGGTARWEARPADDHGTHAAPGAGTGTMTTVKEGGVQVGGADIVTLDFGTGFDITETPDTEVNIAIDLSELDHGSLGGLTDDDHPYILESLLDALGDLIYASADDTPAKLAGNTVAVQKFLGQTGNGSVSAAPAWDTGNHTFGATLAPASLSADQTDYSPTNYDANTGVLRLTASTTTRTIFSLAGGTANRLLYLYNGGVIPIVLAHEYTTGTTAAMRFSIAGAIDYTIPGRAGVLLWYDGASSRWRVTGANIAYTPTAHHLAGVLTPPQITADQDNYSPTTIASATVLRLDADATRSITGIAANASGNGANEGRILIIHNIGANDIVLTHDDGATSTAANRFVFAGDADVTLTPDTVVMIQYDLTSTRWRMIGGTGGGGGGDVATDAIWDAKGDLAVGTGADTADNLTVGANDTILMADSGQATGLKWVASGTPVAIDASGGGGSADTFARGDHTHAHEAAHIAHDTIWAAAGDIVKGTGNDTADILSIGTDGKVLTSTGTTAQWETPSIQVELTNLAQGADKVYYRFPKTLGTHFVTLEIQAQVTPSVGHSFTFMKNGSSVGAVTVTASGTRWTSTVSAFGFTAGDSWSVRHDTNAQDGDESSSHVDEMGRIWAAIY